MLTFPVPVSDHETVWTSGSINGRFAGSERCVVDRAGKIPCRADSYLGWKISRLYDGACMLNLYQWLHDPPAVLQRLVQDELLSPGARVTISLLCGKSEIEEWAPRKIAPPGQPP